MQSVTQGFENQSSKLMLAFAVDTDSLINSTKDMQEMISHQVREKAGNPCLRKNKETLKTWLNSKNARTRIYLLITTTSKWSVYSRT